MNGDAGVTGGLQNGSQAGPWNARGVPSLIGAALFVTTLVWCALTHAHGLGLSDEGYMLRVSARLLAGEIVHRDFIELYGPGVHWLGGLALWLGDGEIVAVRWLLTLFKGVAVVATFGVLRRLTTTPVAVVGALIAIVYWGRLAHILNTPYAAPYSVPLTLVTLWLALRASERRDMTSHLLLGVVAGGSILFKQSLGILNVYALGLAIWGLAMLDSGARDASERQSAAAKALLLTGWGLAALALLIPGNKFLTPRDYAIHILPIHLVMGVVGVAVWRRGLDSRTGALLKQRLLPYAGGVALALAPVLVLYAAWGALGDLLHDVLIIPTFMQNYAVPVMLPPLGLIAFAAGGAGCIIAGLFALRRQLRAAAGAAVAGIALIGFAVIVAPRSNADLYTGAFIWRTATPFDWIMPCLLVVAAVPFLVHACRSGDAPARRTEVAYLLPVLLVQGFLAYQIFPRAGTNIYTIQGALMPLLVFLGHRAYRFGIARGADRSRRIIAAGLCLVVALWLVAPVAWPVRQRVAGRVLMRPAALPHTAGIALPWSEYDRQNLDAVSALVERVRSTEPADARMLLFSSHHMLYFLTDRAPLAARYEYPIFLTGIRMMPVNEIMLAADRETREILEQAPETLVITHDDRTSRWIRDQLPLTTAFVADNYDLDERFGEYRLLKRRTR